MNSFKSNHVNFCTNPPMPFCPTEMNFQIHTLALHVPWLPTSPLTLPTLLPHSTHNHHTTLVTLASTLFLEFTTLLLHKGFFTESFLCQVHSLSTEPHSSFYYCLCFFAYIQLYRKSILLPLIIDHLILLSLSSLYFFSLDVVDTYVFLYYVSPSRI